MAAGSTYTPIATTTLGSSTNSFTFSSIAGTYTDLVVVQSGTTTNGTGIRLRFNGDTGANYSNTILFGTGATAGSVRDSSITSMRMTYEASGQTTDAGVRIANIQNYSNSTTYKTVLIRSSRASSGVDAIVGLWRNTAAITSVTVFGSDFDLASGTTLTLYGIAAA
jgi:hypothetical protein